MQCQNCGTVLPDGTPACPTCGLQFTAPQPQYAPQPGYPQQPYVPQPQYAPQPQPAQIVPPTKKRTGLIVGIIAGVLVVLVAAAAVAVVVLKPSASTMKVTPGAYAPVKVPLASRESTSAIDTTDNDAAEKTVVTFYEAIDSGQLVAVGTLVTAGTKSALTPGMFEGWSKTTFEIARSIVDGDTAYVYGRESTRHLGSQDRGVKFTVLRENGAWLIDKWQPVDEAAVNGGTPSSGFASGTTPLNEASARDIVGSLLQARQVGDAGTIRLLTSANFQQANAAVWLDGVDNTPSFTAYSITSVKKTGAAYTVTVTEQWNSGAETATYTVIDDAVSIVVDSWTSK